MNIVPVGGDDPSVESAFLPYVGVLTREQRDKEGMLLPKGTQVLYNPRDTESFLENTASNRKQFEQQDFAWCAAVRQKVWFPAVPADLRQRLDAVRSAKSSFHAAISGNLHDARRTPFPDLGTAMWFGLLPWTPRVSRVDRVADLTDPASEIVRRQSGTPSDMAWPEEWVQAVAGTTQVTVYALKTLGATVHVVAAFLTRLQFQRAGVPEVAPVTQEAANAVYAAYLRWRSGNGGEAPAYAYVTFGSAAPWPAAVAAVRAGDHLTVFSSYSAEEDDWEARLPEHATVRGGMRDFLERLKPETRDGRIRKLQGVIDEELYNGNPVHLKWLYERLGGEYSRESIQRTMLDLQQTGDYQLYWTKRKQLAIANLAITSPENVRGDGIAAASLKPGRFQRYLLIMLAPIVGAALWVARDLALGRPLSLWAIVILLAFAYVAKIVDRTLRRYTEAKE